jgi:hypothetical protein
MRDPIDPRQNGKLAAAQAQGEAMAVTEAGTSALSDRLPNVSLALPALTFSITPTGVRSARCH